jgi:two-component system response regulator VicR
MTEASGRRKILVVDDEPDVVTIIHGMLEGRGFELLHAYDGDQALDLAARHKPDLVVLDVLMPEQDGWLVCAKLKTCQPSPKIIILTALQPGQSDRFAEFVHADDIIHKPFSKEQLLGKVDTVLAHSASGDRSDTNAGKQAFTAGRR